MGAYNNKFADGVSEDVFAITPNDSLGVYDGSARIPLIRAVYVTTGGTLKYTKVGGGERTITVPSGFLLTCAMTTVWSTGTTATGLLGYA